MKYTISTFSTLALLSLPDVLSLKLAPESAKKCSYRESPLVIGRSSPLDKYILDMTLKNSCKMKRLDDQIDKLCEKIENPGPGKQEIDESIDEPAGGLCWLIAQAPESRD